MQPGGEPLRVVPDGSAYPGGWAAWVGGPVRRIARGDVFVECLDGEGRTGGREEPFWRKAPPPPPPEVFDVIESLFAAFSGLRSREGLFRMTPV